MKTSPKWTAANGDGRRGRPRQGKSSTKPKPSPFQKGASSAKKKKTVSADPPNSPGKTRGVRGRSKYKHPNKHIWWWH